MPQDAILNRTLGYPDFSLDSDGQIEVDDFFDTALDYSIFGEQRADESEMPESSRRRGWIGNEGADYENGSKMWLHYQARINRSLLNDIQDTAILALQWLLDDEFAESIDEPIATADGNSVSLEVTINRSASQVVQRSFTLWNNTGIR